MKIAFVDVTVTNSIGGIQTVVWELSQEFAKRGYEVHVYGGRGSIQPEVFHPSVKVFTFPFIPRERIPDLGSRFKRIVERVSMAISARHPLRENGYDIIFLTKPFDFFLPFLIGSKAKTAYAFISEGTDFFIGDSYLSQRINYWFACSYFNAWQISSHYKRYPKVIYNGVDPERFRPIPRDIELRKGHGIKEEEVLFIFAGRLVGWKGVKYIIEALRFLQPKGLPAKLLIAGDGPELERLKIQVATSGLSDKVLFCGFISHNDLPRYYSIADAAIYPSIGDEAFGISIAEAMSCGKPVIASFIGGIPEVVGTDEKCGFLVSPGDPKEIAEKIIILTERPDIRLAMGKRARERIVNNFTWKRSADRILSVIQKHL